MTLLNMIFTFLTQRHRVGHALILNCFAVARLPHAFQFVKLAFKFPNVAMMPELRHKIVLWRAAQLPFGDGNIVEIGSAVGGSSVYLATPLCLNHEHHKLYCVDTFRGYTGTQDDLPRFEENMKRANVRNVVIPMVGESTSVAAQWNNGAIRLLFIDAGHTYDAVKSDFEAWSKFLLHNSGVIFHDYDDNHVGVKQFVDEIIASGLVEPIHISRGIMMGKFKGR